ncbi:uncharacterized protein LOC121385200 isoform X2 [Gigantopelta aegis]|nr:uncharacterized protein LOC121385200 isoform X2 [Gigantopelta aegis]
MRFVVVFATLLAVACGADDLLTLLQKIHNNPSYDHLSQEHKIMVSEMLAEGTVGELRKYIHTMGPLKFLDLLLAFPEHETYELLQFTSAHLHAEKNLIHHRPLAL